MHSRAPQLCRHGTDSTVQQAVHLQDNLHNRHSLSDIRYGNSNAVSLHGGMRGAVLQIKDTCAVVRRSRVGVAQRFLLHGADSTAQQSNAVDSVLPAFDSVSRLRGFDGTLRK